jgi:hypothetical protein
MGISASTLHKTSELPEATPGIGAQLKNFRYTGERGRDDGLYFLSQSLRWGVTALLHCYNAAVTIGNSDTVVPLNGIQRSLFAY